MPENRSPWKTRPCLGKGGWRAKAKGPKKLIANQGSQGRNRQWGNKSSRIPEFTAGQSAGHQGECPGGKFPHSDGRGCFGTPSPTLSLLSVHQKSFLNHTGHGLPVWNGNPPLLRITPPPPSNHEVPHGATITPTWMAALPTPWSIVICSTDTEYFHHHSKFYQTALP